MNQINYYEMMEPSREELNYWNIIFSKEAENEDQISQRKAVKVLKEY